MIKYAIVSYHRKECLTVRALTGLGVKQEEITIFLQDEQDLKDYTGTHPNIKKVLNKNSGVSANRNNALKHYSNGERVVLLDDDVISFSVLFAKNENKIVSEIVHNGSVFKRILEETFDLCQEIGSPMWGVSPTGNALIAKGRLFTDGTFSVNRLFQGGLIGHIIDGQYYDESFKMVEDYEIQLRYYRSGATLIRRNDFTANKKPNGNYKGGLYEEYKSDNLKPNLTRLKKKYPDLISIKSDFSGVRQKT